MLKVIEIAKYLSKMYKLCPNSVLLRYFVEHMACTSLKPHVTKRSCKEFWLTKSRYNNPNRQFNTTVKCPENPQLYTFDINSLFDSWENAWKREGIFAVWILYIHKLKLWLKALPMRLQRVSAWGLILRCVFVVAARLNQKKKKIVL